MKTNHLFRIIIPCFFIFNACQPKDKAVVTPKEREQILEQQKAKKQQNSGLMRLGSFGASAFLIDQQAESLNWLMFLFDSAYLGNGYSASNDQDKNFPLLQNNGSLKSNLKGKYHVTGELEINIRKQDGDLFDKMTVNGNEVLQFQSDSLQLESSLTDHRSVEIKPEGNDQFTVRVEKDGDLNLSKSGQLEKVKYTLSSLMTVKVDLSQKTISIAKSLTSMKIFRSPELNFKIESENELTYQFNQQCIVALGKVKIVDARNTAKNKTLLLDEKSARVEGTNWTYDLGECESQPLVDIYKLLKY